MGVFIAMLIVMPYTHYKAYKYGRVSINAEIGGRPTFVINGKVGFIDVARYFDQCSVCHGGSI
jgi:hypothetical protein